jgi:hypothetical protein
VADEPARDSLTAHPLAGHVSVDASVARIRKYRWVEERLMRILGGWIALTPELPVKLLFGRHVWDCAQHADLWGRRLPELRATAHQAEPPSEGFAHLVDLIDGLQERHESIARVVAVYRVLKPHLIAAYAAHLSETNPVYEPPTRRIIVRCLDEERRHVAAGAVVLDRLAGPARSRAEEWERRLLDELARVDGLVAVATRPASAVAAPDPSGDLVALDSAFDPGVVVGPLADALDAQRRAFLDGDLDALAAHIVPAARGQVLALFQAAGPAGQLSVVACARIGAYRIVKVAVRGSCGASVVQLEWRNLEAGWRIVGGELVRSEPAG